MIVVLLDNIAIDLDPEPFKCLLMKVRYDCTVIFLAIIS